MDDTGFAGLIAPGDGRFFSNPIGGAIALMVRDAATHGSLSVYDNVIPAHAPGPRRRRHLRHDEIFYVITGTLAVEIEGETHTASAGSFVLIPRGMAHRPSNPTGEPAHMLLMFAPGGMDTFFVDAAERHIQLGGSPDAVPPPGLAGFCEQYGFAYADLPA